MIFLPEIGFNDEIKTEKTKMLKLSEEVHKAIIRKSIWDIDEEKVEALIRFATYPFVRMLGPLGTEKKKLTKSTRRSRAGFWLVLVRS